MLHACYSPITRSCQKNGALEAQANATWKCQTGTLEPSKNKLSQKLAVGLYMAIYQVDIWRCLSHLKPTMLFIANPHTKKTNCTWLITDMLVSVIKVNLENFLKRCEGHENDNTTTPGPFGAHEKHGPPLFIIPHFDR